MGKNNKNKNLRVNKVCKEKLNTLHNKLNSNKKNYLLQYEKATKPEDVDVFYSKSNYVD